MLDLDKIKSFEILSKDEQIEALALIDKWKNIKARTKCRDDFFRVCTNDVARLYHGQTP